MYKVTSPGGESTFNFTHKLETYTASVNFFKKKKKLINFLFGYIRSWCVGSIIAARGLQRVWARWLSPRGLVAIRHVGS